MMVISGYMYVMGILHLIVVENRFSAETVSAELFQPFQSRWMQMVDMSHILELVRMVRKHDKSTRPLFFCSIVTSRKYGINEIRYKRTLLQK